MAGPDAPLSVWLPPFSVAHREAAKACGRRVTNLRGICVANVELTFKKLACARAANQSIELITKGAWN